MSSKPIAPRAAGRIRRRLLAWYRRSRRDLPWRRTRDPYAVWLSETMLQQTQTATVIPYYQAFLRRFQTIQDLAAADLDEVLRLWAGLGYYSRARNLHRAAREVVARFDGGFPTNVEQLRTLPGVGAYTAGAVASIAFDRRAAVVDGNVARVLARLFDVDEDLRSGAGRKRAWRLAEALLPEKRCGDFNQALMELGALVCTPGAAPQCSICPLRGNCRARRNGTAAQRPVKSQKTPVKDEVHAALLARRGDMWLVRRRPERGLWGGLWEFPSLRVEGRRQRETAAKMAGRLFGVTAAVAPRAAYRTVHLLTHRRIKLACFLARPVGGGALRLQAKTLGGTALEWVSLDALRSRGISALTAMVIRFLSAHSVEADPISVRDAAWSLLAQGRVAAGGPSGPSRPRSRRRKESGLPMRVAT